MDKQRRLSVKKIVGSAVIQAVLGMAIFYGVSPFAPAFLYAQGAPSMAMACGIVMVVVEFFCGSRRLSIFAVVALLAYFLPHVCEKWGKKPLPEVWKKLGKGIHFLVWCVGVGNTVSPIVTLTCGVVTVCFGYVFSLCVRAADFLLTGPLSDAEKAAFLLFLAALGIGLSRIQVGYFCLLYPVVGFLTPFLTCVYGGAVGLFAAVSLGVGYAFFAYDVTLLALFAFCALASGMFGRSARPFPVAAGLMAIAVFTLYFSSYGQEVGWQLLQYGLGGVAFLLIPRKKLVALKESKEAAGGALALRYLLNRSRYVTAMQVSKLKDVFSQMSAVLGAFRAEGQKPYSLLAATVERECCAKCERYEACKSKGLPQALLTLSRLTLIKNKATVTQIPPLLERECVQLAALVGSAYNHSLELRKDVAQAKTHSALKSALAQSYAGVKDILNAQQRAIAAPISYDFEREDRIKEALSVVGIVCSQVLVTIDTDYAVTLLVKRSEASEEKIEEVVTKVLGIPSVVTNTDDSVARGWQIVTLAERPLFRMLTGVCAQAKQEGATGDSHVFTRLNEHRVMVSLCDGMGSGKQASDLSDKAITLVEAFYKAGFSHEMTIGSVNSFLRIDAEESFSALDVLVFDRYEGVVDIVKLASPPCYIKKKDHTVRVDSSALPLGILGEIRPSVTSRKAEDGDCFVLVSDGVADCFVGDSLSAYVNNADARNPQKLSEEIVQEAKKRRKSGREDDMTAIVCSVCRQR